MRPSGNTAGLDHRQGISMCSKPLLAALITILLSHGVGATDVVRYPLADSSFPISAAVEVPAGKALIFVSGNVPPVVDTKAAKDSVSAYGDTRTQTVGVLSSIQKQLQAMGLSLGDVVKMQVFLVGDDRHGGRMDFDGFMAGYTQFFGTKAQPHLPARSTFQVAGLSNPGYRVEIEVIAARP
jgi:enamine deaminase RidA (YjgF/YER057c/UK114 family)